MHNYVRAIDNVKDQVQQLIQDNLYREVTPETKYKISGIYMIYIDNFTNDKIVPIYIGQSKDIQTRYKQHFSEILSLNRLSYDEYEKYFFFKSKSYYEGAFKACKVFKYMIENNFTLQDFRMIVLEEVEEEYLDEKEQAYFQKLLPSFFGFNQLNSFLKRLKSRFSNSQMSNAEIDDYLSILLQDIKGIYSYYEYGFTRFNFEHSMPRDITHILKEKEQLDSDILLKFDEVNLSLYELCKRYIPNFEEMQRLYEKTNKLYDVYKAAENEYKATLDLIKRGISEKFEELKIYNDEAITNFISSIRYKDIPKYKELFNKYLKSQNCKLNFYELFVEQIKNANKKSGEKDDKKVPYHAVLDLYLKREDEIRPERYKMIFPSCQFESFPLGDRSTSLPIKINEDNNLLNTCHIRMYISNDGVNRSIEFDKEPFIIRLDYCYIDREGNKSENKYYIDNETTKNCQSGIKYFEKYFYNRFAMPQRFSISSLIDNKQDNSFISVPAEYKHGINDYTIKDKKLIKLSAVLDEIQYLTDGMTGFNVDVSESYRCLELCMINEGLQNNEFVKKLVTKKLPKIRKGRKASIKKRKINF